MFPIYAHHGQIARAVLCNVYGCHLVLILVYGIASLKCGYDGYLMLNAFSSEKYTYSDFHVLILSLCQLSIICACLRAFRPVAEISQVNIHSDIIAV